MSELTEAMIINGVVLATVLATDLGPARKIGRGRLLRVLRLSGGVVRARRQHHKMRRGHDLLHS